MIIIYEIFKKYYSMNLQERISKFRNSITRNDAVTYAKYHYMGLIV